jgi:hypothetical protein
VASPDVFDGGTFSGKTFRAEQRLTQRHVRDCMLIRVGSVNPKIVAGRTDQPHNAGRFMAVS